MRKTFLVLVAGCLAGGAMGCGPPPAPEPASQGDLDIAATNAIADTGVTNAILAQHTLFPYHFVDGSTDLNDLGRRELAVLAAHYRQTSGDLNVRPGDEPLALYQGRVLRVQEFLLSAGVPADRVAVLDGPPGGTGISSERVVFILSQERTQAGASGGASGGAAGAGVTGGSTGASK